MQLIPGVAATTAALTAERTRIEVITQNIAHANATFSPQDAPIQRKQVVFEAVLQPFLNGNGSSPNATLPVARVQDDPRPPRLDFEPNHPYADANGHVARPNINVHEEMADYIVSSRTYEANLAAYRLGRQMVQQTLTLGKRM